MSQLHIIILRETPTILQPAYSFTIKSNGMIEDVIVTLNSWEYPINFFVLSPKDNMGGYPLILGRPWLDTKNAYIAYRSRKITISNGVHTKDLTLYSLAQPLLLDNQVIWLELGDDDPKSNSLHQLMMIGR